MKRLHLYRNLVVILFLDVIAICFSYYVAHLVRYDFNINVAQQIAIVKILPMIIMVKIACFILFNLYKGMWRFTSMRDALNIFLASVVSSCFIVGVLLLYNRFSGFSRSVFVIDLCFTILAIAGLRLIVRIFFEHVNGFSANDEHEDPKPQRLLIIGAGSMGEKIYRLIRDSAGKKYEVVGFLDDHPVKIGKLIHGVKVLGKINEIRLVAEKVEADEALIAITTASANEMRAIIKHCKRSGIPFKTLPSPDEMINGNYSIGSIREVSYTDLLGRKDVRLDEGQNRQVHRRTSGYSNRSGWIYRL